MEINLQCVREVLRTSFGRESFVASFITEVKADGSCPTAGIDAHGVMTYNPAFAGKHVTGPPELFCLVAHELMHPMFGHFVYRSGPLENIGADMVINATISLLFARHSGSGAMFTRFYRPIGLEGLLRPDSDMHQSRYARLYRDFYDNHCIGQKLSTGEVIQALRVLTPMVEVPTIILLGNHDGGSCKTGGECAGQVFDSEALARIAENLRRVAQRPSGHPA